MAGNIGADGILIGVGRDDLAPVLRLIDGWARSVSLAAGAAVDLQGGFFGTDVSASSSVPQTSP